MQLLAYSLWLASFVYTNLVMATKTIFLGMPAVVEFLEIPAKLVNGTPAEHALHPVGH